MNAADIYTPRQPRRSSRLRLRGCDFVVHEWGAEDGPLLVYLHGWGDCGPTFQFVVDELVGRWRVVAPDLRGFGDSRVESTAYWFPDYLADLDRWLDHFSPAQPVCLVGHSMGGNVAGLYAGARPQRVAAFVNLEGFGLPDRRADEAPGRYREWLDAARTLDGFATYRDFGQLAARLERRHPRLGSARAGFVARCWGVEADGEVRLKADPVHKLPNPVLYRRAEAEACWRAIEAPTLLLAGHDSEIRRAILAEGAALADAVPVPGSVIVELAEAGHMLHFDQPAAVAREIERFLAGVL